MFRGFLAVLVNTAFHDIEEISLCMDLVPKYDSLLVVTIDRIQSAVDVLNPRSSRDQKMIDKYNDRS